MDIDEYVSSNFVTPKIIKELVNKTAVILDEGKMNEDTPFGKAVFEITIELSNGVKATYGMNKTSAQNIAEKFGKDTANWVGKSIRFELQTMTVRREVKDVIYAYPVEQAQTL